MRPGIIPEGIIERIALLSGLVPTPLRKKLKKCPPA